MNQIETIISKYIGVPYLHGGRDIKTGLDCLGLCYLIYRDFGINIPDGDGSEYPPDWFMFDKERYIRGILTHGQAVELSKLKPLDFVYFSMAGIITHTGVMVDTYRFIHVLENKSVCIEQLSSPWRRRLAGARRFV
jgi:cell wall-associated NlpC family hydrolase